MLDEENASPREMTAPGVHDAVVAQLPPPPAKVLDIGGGQGALTSRLLRLGYQVVFVDISPPKVAGVDCVLASAESSLPFRRETFDIVVMIEVVEHLENPMGAVRGALTVLRVGGTIVVTTPNIQNYLARAHFLRSGLYGRWFREEDLSGSDRARGTDHITPVHPRSLIRMLTETGAMVTEIFCNQEVSVRQLNSMWTIGAKLFEVFGPKLMFPKDNTLIRGDILLVKAVKTRQSGRSLGDKPGVEDTVREFSPPS